MTVVLRPTHNSYLRRRGRKGINGRRKVEPEPQTAVPQPKAVAHALREVAQPGRKLSPQAHEPEYSQCYKCNTCDIIIGFMQSVMGAKEARSF